MTFIEYTTIDGDRLDLIAHKAFGNSFNWQPIIDQNPHLPLTAEYQAGIKLIIPVQSVDLSPSNNKELLPPWKR